MARRRRAQRRPRRHRGDAYGAIDIRLPKHAKKELEAYLDCGLLCRGFARLRCDGYDESRLVAFSCKGRGFCPSCLGRRMCATAANLIEDVRTVVALRQWVLTFPFPWRRRLAQDGALLGVLTRLFVDSVERLYRERAVRRGARGAAKTGSVTVLQRTESDLRLNPHLHVSTGLKPIDHPPTDDRSSPDRRGSPVSVSARASRRGTSAPAGGLTLKTARPGPRRRPSTHGP